MLVVAGAEGLDELDQGEAMRAALGVGGEVGREEAGAEGCAASEVARGVDLLGLARERIVAGGTPFGPGLVSANLTPDAKGRPEGLTLVQFVQTIRTGRDHDDGHILQVMPWPVYQDLRFDDLKAIYTYLRAIPSRPTPKP